jgi:hypothetical protein
VVQVTPVVPAPTAPTGVSAALTASGTVTVSWTDASTTETRFLVQRATVTGGVVGTFATINTVTRTAAQGTATGGTALTSVMTGLTANTTYAFRVVAANATFTGAVTTPNQNYTDVQFTTPAFVVPNAVTALTVGTVRTSVLGLNLPTDTVTVNWTAPVANAGPALTGYTIQWSTTAAFAAVLGSGTATASATSFQTLVARGIATAPNPANLYFRVLATNAIGNSAAASSGAVALK